MPWNRGTRALIAGGLAAGLLLGACSDDAEEEGEILETPEVGEGVEEEGEGGLVEEEGEGGLIEEEEE